MVRPKISSRRNRFEEILLPAELCREIPIPSELILWAKLSPSIYYKIDQLYKFWRVREVLRNRIDFDLLREALTTTGTNEDVNYERLEKLGDSILKFLVSDCVFNKHPEYNEAMLTGRRQEKVSNDHLHSVCTGLKLYRYMQVSCFSVKHWKPPLISFSTEAGHEDSSDEDEDLNSNGFSKEVVIGDKQIADIIESLLGAAYVQDGFRLTNILLNNFGLTEPTDIVTLEQSANTQTILGYTFNNANWFVQAITHSSLPDETSYERLEFLGDAVLDMVIVEYLYYKFQDARPGILTPLHHQCVKNGVLAVFALDTGLVDWLRHNQPGLNEKLAEFKEIRERVRKDNKDFEGIPEEKFKVFADVFESTLGAIYMDSQDYATVRTVVLRVMDEYLSKYIDPSFIKEHPHSRMSNWSQKQRVPSFKMKFPRIVADSGTVEFITRILINGEVVAEGRGTSRFLASSEAAEILFSKYPEFP